MQDKEDVIQVPDCLSISISEAVTTYGSDFKFVVVEKTREPKKDEKSKATSQAPEEDTWITPGETIHLYLPETGGDLVCPAVAAVEFVIILVLCWRLKKKS